MSKLFDETRLNPDHVTVLNKYDDSKQLLFKVERRLPDCKQVGVIRVRANDWVEAVEDAKKHDLMVLISACGVEKGNQLFNLTEYKVV